MTQPELDEIDRLTADIDMPLWAPAVSNLPQQQAFDSPANVIGYGGSGGGGKTDLGLGLAIRKHQRSVVFRREATQLRDIVDRFKEIVRDAGRLNEGLLVWRNGSQVIKFGGLKDRDDVSKWRGRPNDLYVFDEGTEFLEEQVRFVTAWNRSVDPTQKCQVLLAFNPPNNVDGRWIIDYFGPWLDPTHPRPAEPGDLRWYATLDGKEVECTEGPGAIGEPFEHDGETIYPRSRTFIPARLEDNPYLRDTGYRATLQNLPEPLRSQLLYGDMTIGLQDDPWQVIPTQWIMDAQKRWLADGLPHDLRGRPIPMTCVGVDVARGGKDETVLAPRYSNWFGELKAHPGSETPDGYIVAGEIAKCLTNGGYANIDGIGVGASVYDILRGSVGNRANSIIFSESADGERDQTNTFGFVNKRALFYWRFREALDPANRQNIALPPDRELLADLCAPKWSMQTNGVKIESKEDIEDRTGRGMHKGDAVVLAALPSYAPEYASVRLY